MTTELASYHYPKQFRQFMNEVGSHEMTVLHEKGHYRHLRFKNPNSSMWHFDIITWPGSLVIRGDIGEGHAFTRTPNMLAFFDRGQPLGHINPSYWSEKLDRGRRSVYGYSEDKFEEYVKDLVKLFIEQHSLNEEQASSLQSDVEYEVLSEQYSLATALNALMDFSWEGYRLDHDSSESEFSDYDHHFLIACHAILWGARKYHELRGRSDTGER